MKYTRICRTFGTLLPGIRNRAASRISVTRSFRLLDYFFFASPACGFRLMSHVTLSTYDIQGGLFAFSLTTLDNFENFRTKMPCFSIPQDTALSEL